MNDTPSSQQGYPGQATPFNNGSDWKVDEFMIEAMLARIPGAHLVKITKVSTQGQVGPVGFVSVEPIVKTMDGQGNTTPHGVIHNIPFFRLQGGADKAVIIDPKVGDLGVAVFAGRDISAAKKNKKVSPPGSFRRHDMADGLYIGGFLGGTPKCYIRFTDDNKIIASPDEGATTITMEANKVTAKVGTTTTLVMEPTKITAKVNPLEIVVKTDKIWLGKEFEGSKVMTEAGLSEIVYAKVS